MILKLDYVFAPFFHVFVLWEVELEISSSMYFTTRTYWINSFLFK